MPHKYQIKNPSLKQESTNGQAFLCILIKENNQILIKSFMYKYGINTG